MNRKRLVAVLEEQIYIYDIATMKHVYTIETGSNPNGLFPPNTPSSQNSTSPPLLLLLFQFWLTVTGICSLSSSAENSYLVFPHPNSSSPTFQQPTHTPSTPSSPVQHTGEVLLFDTLTLSPINIISAHKTPIALLSLSPRGDLLATASDKGTVIRVFSVPQGEKLFQFRRGSYPARITSMAFSASGEYLVVGSDTETVHVFRCSSPKTGVKSSSSGSSSGGRPWMAGLVGGSSENAVVEDDMDKVIEQKRRNGSMGYSHSQKPILLFSC
jgi:autophagy-related protein 18